jgi:hypothetical protein
LDVGLLQLLGHIPDGLGHEAAINLEEETRRRGSKAGSDREGAREREGGKGMGVRVRQ